MKGSGEEWGLTTTTTTTTVKGGTKERIESGAINGNNSFLDASAIPIDRSAYVTPFSPVWPCLARCFLALSSPCPLCPLENNKRTPFLVRNDVEGVAQ